MRVGTLISYPSTDTHLLSDEDIKALYYSTPFYDRVSVSINYPLQSGAPPGLWPLIRVVEWLDLSGGNDLTEGWLVVVDMAGQFIHLRYISPCCRFGVSVLLPDYHHVVTCSEDRI